MAKRDPLNELRSMQERMNQLLYISREKMPGEPFDDSFWQPAVDIYEDHQFVVVKMELPEVALEDIRVQVDNHNLTIQGQRRLDRDEKGRNYHRLERCYGPFRRTFSLPTTVDEEKIQATCEQGILKIVLPKKPASRP